MPITQSYHKVWNIHDEHALLMGLRRLPGETNTQLNTRILNIGKYWEGTTRQGLVNAISSAMGYDQYNVRERRIFLLSHRPWRDATITVTVDGAEQTEVTAGEYDDATTGYIVWADEDEEYTQILEFIDPPDYSRRPGDRKHSGVYIEVEYQYEDKDRIRWHVDKCNPYDEEDERWMGSSPETEGSVKVGALNHTSWVDNVSSGLKNSDGTPTEQLEAIWKSLDTAIPTSWGE